MTARSATKAVRLLPVSQRIFGPPPARNLADAVRLCDPFTPLDPAADAELREDLDALRGGDRLAKIVRNIRRSGGTPTLHFLTGHLGSGKTTELLRMKQQLERSPSAPDTFSVLFLDADESLDRYDVDLEDILVALWSGVYEHAPQAAAKVLGPIWTQQVKGALASLALNLPEKVPDAVGKLLGDFRLPSPEQRTKVRAALGPVIGALIDGLNRALAEIQGESAQTMVILIDNLEKLSLGQRDRVERLYVERMGALKQLNAHLVITVPIYLCFAAAGSSLIGLYGGEQVILPMIKVRNRMDQEGGDNREGLVAMAHLLKKRVDFERLFEGGDTAAEEIARLSGGCIRHALRMVQSAVNEHDDPPVTVASVGRAATIMQAEFERALPEAWVPMLREVARSNRFPEDCSPETKRDILRNLYVLEYQNGEPDPWWAVHPLVERCRKYREHSGS